MNRRDLLSECAQPGTPIDVLKEAWCSRCGNPECVRSVVGLSKFEERIKDWETKLFIAPPQLSPDDPRFGLITAQKFITIEPGRTPEIRSDWMDPRDLKEPEAKPAAPPLVVAPPVPAVQAAPEPPRAEARAATPSKPAASPSSTPTAARMILAGANAANQSGKILPGGQGRPTTEVDPWAVPDPPQPADQVVQPGAKIRMGGGSGV